MAQQEFIPYEQALEFKELGFEEISLDAYYKTTDGGVSLVRFPDEERQINYPFERIPAPLYQQAFRWFKENYRLDSYVKYLYKSKIKVGYYYGIDEYEGVQFQMEFDDYFETHEEAELECLIKLIKIVKENK